MFLVEGAKSVLELLHSGITVRTLIATEVFIKAHANVWQQRGMPEVVEASEHELSALGAFKNNNAALAVAAIPELPALHIAPDEYVLALDDIRDPGNLGTIIRIADWYGIHKIVCSPETTDPYSPKVISASMGSFLRVKLWQQPLQHLLSAAAVPVYGTFLQEARSVHEFDFGKGGIVLLGNESEGIGEALSGYVSQRIHIPRFGGAESLNVAVATAVICDNIRRTVKAQAYN